MLKKYPLQVFIFTKFTHPKVNNLLWRVLTYKSGRKEYLFHMKDKFQKYPFFSSKNTVFDTLNAPRAFLWKKYPFHTFFLVMHVYTVIWVSPSLGNLKTKSVIKFRDLSKDTKHVNIDPFLGVLLLAAIWWAWKKEIRDLISFFHVMR